jgi:hypothetical protein
MSASGCCCKGDCGRPHVAFGAEGTAVFRYRLDSAGDNFTIDVDPRNRHERRAQAKRSRRRR